LPLLYIVGALNLVVVISGFGSEDRTRGRVVSMGGHLGREEREKGELGTEEEEVGR